MPTTSLNSISRWRHPSQTKPPPPRGDAVLSLSSWWFSRWPDTLEDGEEEQGKAVEEGEGGDWDGGPPSPIPVLGGWLLGPTQLSGRAKVTPAAAFQEEEAGGRLTATRGPPPQPCIKPNKESHFHELGKLFKIAKVFEAISPVFFVALHNSSPMTVLSSGVQNILRVCYEVMRYAAGLSGHLCLLLASKYAFPLPQLLCSLFPLYLDGALHWI